MGRENNERVPLTYDDDNTEKKLRRACIEGDLEAVKSCLDEGGDINSPNQQLNTSIHLAAFYGKLDILQLLLQQDKAHINATNQIDKPPEYYAANEETEEVFRVRSGTSDVSINHNEENPSSKQQGVDKKKNLEEVKQETPKIEPKKEEKKIPEKKPEQKKPEEKQSETKKDDIAKPKKPVELKEEKSEPDESNKGAKQKESIEVISEGTQQKNTTKGDQRSDKNPAISKVDNKTKKVSGNPVDHSEVGGLRKERERSKNIGNKYNVEGVARLKIGAGQIKRGNFHKMTDHEFEWSDDFKKRQQMSVYDRLQGKRR